MTFLNYPLDVQRRSERRWTARLNTIQPRRALPRGTNMCSCGHPVIAPSNSACLPASIVNYWQCSACGSKWETIADVN
jgi:hypothetical protein